MTGSLGPAVLWPWFEFWMQGAALAWEAQEVIALRLMKLAEGGPEAASEAALMVTEKLAALAESQTMLLSAALRMRHEDGAGRVMRLYRSRVGANRRRLGRGRG